MQFLMEFLLLNAILREQFFKADAVFNMLMIFFWSIWDKYFSVRLQVVTIVFSFSVFFLFCGRCSSRVFVNMSFGSILNLEYPKLVLWNLNIH